MSKTSRFETSDFWLAVYLKASSVKLDGIAWRDSKATFIFDEIESVKERVKEFYNGKSISISKIKSNYDDLKSALHNLNRL